MAGERVAFLVGEGFEDSELRIPYDRLRAAGVRVQIVGPEAGQELKGYRGREVFRADLGIDEAEADDFAALVIPGGHSPDHLRADERFVQFVRAFDATGRPLAAVCHGPQLLIAAGLVRGRTLTAWRTVQEDLRQIGADVRDEAVVRDGNWITSRQPDDLEAFSAAVLQALEGAEERREEPEPAAEARAVSVPFARKGEMPVAEAAEEELPGQRPRRSAEEQPGLRASPSHDEGGGGGTKE